MPNKITRVIIDNRTPYDFIVYFNGLLGYKLHIVLTIYPKIAPDIALMYQEIIVRSGECGSINLEPLWKEFNGVTLDTSRVSAKTLGANKFAVENSREFVVIIREMTN